MNGSPVGDGTLAALRAFTSALTALATAGAPAAPGGPAESCDRLARIGAMEDLRSVLAAAQAAEVAALAAERRAAVEAEIATVPRPGIGARRRRDEVERRTVSDVGRARRISPWQASRFVAFALRAPADLPATFALLAAGRLSERRAALVLNAVTPLPPEQRRAVDTRLAPDLPGWGDREVDQRARAVVYELDPAGVVARNAYAHEQRRVSVRPAPDCMAWVTTLTSMPDAAALRAQLERDATAAVAAGDPRTRNQIMSDLVVERVSGRSAAAGPPVAIQLVVSDATLAGGDVPARFADGTPYPAPMARDLALGPALDDGRDPIREQARRTVRRLFAGPAGRLVTAETGSREFTPAQADLIRLRDGTCTTPWCDAPIRHIDHHDPHVRGGPTSIANGRGLCQWCNVTKGAQEPARRPADVAGSSPPAPRPPRPPLERSPLERRVSRRLRTRRALRRRAPGIEVEYTAPDRHGRPLHHATELA